MVSLDGEVDDAEPGPAQHPSQRGGNGRVAPDAAEIPHVWACPKGDVHRGPPVHVDDALVRDARLVAAWLPAGAGPAAAPAEAAREIERELRVSRHAPCSR